MSLREALGRINESLTFPEIVEPQARLLKGVKLLVATQGDGTETVTHFTVGKDAYSRNWIYAYLDEDALIQGTAPDQSYAVFLFDDLVEIAKSNDIGGAGSRSTSTKEQAAHSCRKTISTRRSRS